MIEGSVMYALIPLLLLPVLVGAWGVVLVAAEALTPPAQRGQQIYLQGISPHGDELTAVLGTPGTEVPAATLPCVNCHGHDGRGRPEGGVRPSNITWVVLTTPYGVTQPSGRQHPPYTEPLLKRAITMGLDAAGNPLHTAMPRYRLSQRDASDLLAYLKQLGQGVDRGVTETTIRVGALLPPAGHLTDMGQAIRAVLIAYFDDLNQRGGIYNRQVEVRFTLLPEAPNAYATAVRTFLEEDQIFALTASFIAGAEAEIAALMGDDAVPLVGAFTLMPQTSWRWLPSVFYVDGGLESQGHALAKFVAMRYATPPPRAAILSADAQRTRYVAAAIQHQCQHAGWPALEEIDVPHGPFDAALLVQHLREWGTEVLFVLGPGAVVGSVLHEAHRQKWQPLMLVPGLLAGPELFAIPEPFERRLFLSFSTLPADYTPDGMAEYRRLVAAHGLFSHHLTTQLSALAAAKILVEGLKRAGRELSRAKLIEALEGLYKFQTGFTPPVTYGPQRRIGAQGAYIVALNRATRQLVPISAWIELDQR